MAYNEALATRLRALLAKEPGLTEQKMFGGVAFMVGGNMACGIIRDDLMLRVGADLFEEALAQPFTRPMDFAHRPMVGMVYVAAGGYTADEDLRRWVNVALGHVRTRPSKSAKPPKAKAAATPANKKRVTK